MSEHRFHLQKYRFGNKTTCPHCGRSRCFVRYIDEEGEISFPDNVGRCDHENSCGYHYSPKDFFTDNPDVLAKNGTCNNLSCPTYKSQEKKSEPVKPSYIPLTYVERSLSHYEINPLYRYFCRVFGREETDKLFRLYYIGTSAKWQGSAVFWQIDINGFVRTGKVMCYNHETGHRVKEPQACVSWAHSELKLPNFHLKQCLFGEHLLKSSPSSTVMLVESEKTAVVMSHFIPEYIWLATGGKNGCFNIETMQVLKDREVALVADLGATEQWKEKSSLLSKICKRVIVSNVLERISSKKQREQGLDIADFLLMEETPHMLLERMMRRNPSLRILVEGLELEIVE